MLLFSWEVVGERESLSVCRVVAFFFLFFFSLSLPSLSLSLPFSLFQTYRHGRGLVVRVDDVERVRLGRRVNRVLVGVVGEDDLDQRLLGHRRPSLLDEPEAVVVVDRVGRQREAVDPHLRGRRDLVEDGRLAVPVPERLGRVEEEEVVAGRVVREGVGVPRRDERLGVEDGAVGARVDVGLVDDLVVGDAVDVRRGQPRGALAELAPARGRADVAARAAVVVVVEEVLAHPGAAPDVGVGRRGRARGAAAPTVGGVDGEVVARRARARQAGARGRRGAPRRVDLRSLAARVRRQAGVDRLAGVGARLAGGAESRQAGAAGDGLVASRRAVATAGAPEGKRERIEVRESVRRGKEEERSGGKRDFEKARTTDEKKKEERKKTRLLTSCLSGK